MKSLEILEHIKNAPEFMGGSERYKRSINSPIRYIEDITVIKQDLEVLEIIKIKNVNLYSIKGFLNMHKKYSMSLEDVLKAYNLNCPKLILEELLKLKQWLEEQNERD